MQLGPSLNLPCAFIVSLMGARVKVYKKARVVQMRRNYAALPSASVWVWITHWIGFLLYAYYMGPYGLTLQWILRSSSMNEHVSRNAYYYLLGYTKCVSQVSFLLKFTFCSPGKFIFNNRIVCATCVFDHPVYFCEISRLTVLIPFYLSQDCVFLDNPCILKI